MKYLALDQSLNLSGWAVYQDKELVTFGTFKIKSSHSIEKRLHQLLNELNSLSNQFGPFDYVFFEDIQYQNNKETYKKLAFVQSVIYLWCYWQNINYSVLAPSHWRKIISEKYNIKFGKARAEQKKTCVNFIKQQMNLDSISEDEADAVAIGLAGIIEKDNTIEWA